MTTSNIANKQQCENILLSSQFWGEGLLETYVTRSTLGSRIPGLPTLAMCAFIPISLVQSCLTRSGACFARATNLLVMHFTGTQPTMEHFWPGLDNLENFKSAMIPHTSGLNYLEVPSVDQSKQNRIFAFDQEMMNGKREHWVYKAYTALAYSADAHLLLGVHRMTRLLAAIPVEAFFELVRPRENLGTNDVNSSLSGKVMVIAPVTGGDDSSPINEAKIKQFVFNDVFPFDANSLEHFEICREQSNRCYSDLQLDLKRLKEVAPCLSPMQRRLMVDIVFGKM